MCVWNNLLLCKDRFSASNQNSLFLPVVVRIAHDGRSNAQRGGFFISRGWRPVSSEYRSASFSEVSNCKVCVGFFYLILVKTEKMSVFDVQNVRFELQFPFPFSFDVVNVPPPHFSRMVFVSAVPVVFGKYGTQSRSFFCATRFSLFLFFSSLLKLKIIVFFLIGESPHLFVF